MNYYHFVLADIFLLSVLFMFYISERSMGPSHVSIFHAFSSDTLNSRYRNLSLDVFPSDLCTSFQHNLQFESVELMEVKCKNISILPWWCYIIVIVRFFIFIYSIWNLVFGSWFVPGGKGENGDIDNLKSVRYIGVNMSIIVSDDPIYRLFKIIESIFLTLYQFLSSFLLISPVISINIFVAKLY